MLIFKNRCELHYYTLDSEFKYEHKSKTWLKQVGILVKLVN